MRSDAPPTERLRPHVFFELKTFFLSISSRLGLIITSPGNRIQAKFFPQREPVILIVRPGMPRHKRSGSGNGCLEFDDGDEDCGKSGDKPGQRNAANARERARMRILSKAFSRLKTTLPWVPPDTKLSKLDTLRLATSYIAHLRTILTDDGGNPPPIVHPLNLTWPFTIQQQTGDRPLRSPDSWSTEDRQTSDGMPNNLEIMSGFGERPTCSLGPGSEDRTRLFYSRSNHFISDIRHRDSDSLLNIG